MPYNLKAEILPAPSDSRVTVNDQHLGGVNRIEIVVVQGKPTQAMLWLTPAYITADIPIWDIDSPTARTLAEKIAKALNIPSFTDKIYAEIIDFTQVAENVN